MTFYLLSLGTRGDFELFLILGKELRRRNHDVLLGASPSYQSRVLEAGLRFEPLGFGTQDDLAAILRSLAPVEDKNQRTYQYYLRWLKPQLAACQRRIAASAGRADYFINNLKMILHDARGVIPGAAVTYDPPAEVADLPAYGTQAQGGKILDLVAMSRPLVDPDGRWGPGYRFTGFWRDPERPRWAPSPELAAFLEEGEPPVVVTMGSMVMFDLDRFERDVAEAVRLAGRRAILVGGWSGIAPGRSGDILRVGEVPYDWLFPRSCCVVHHGGCGTVAAVLRSGRPSILLPQITAQRHFGTMLAREYLATGVFEIRAIDPRVFALAVDRAATGDRARAAAVRWKETVDAEGGVAEAADLIEAHAANLGIPPHAR